MKFNENLSKYRKIKGLTQDDLAEKVGVSRQSVSKWETGDCMPDVSKLIALSCALEVSIDELCGKPVNHSTEADQSIPESGPAKTVGKHYIFTTALIALAAAILFGVGGYLAGVRSNVPDTAQSTAYQLPDTIEVTGIEFRALNNKLLCSFAPSVYAQELTYTVNLIADNYSALNSSAQAEYKNGICTAEIDVIENCDYRVVLTVSNGSQEKSVIIATKCCVNAYSVTYIPVDR